MNRGPNLLCSSQNLKTKDCQKNFLFATNLVDLPVTSASKLALACFGFLHHLLHDPF